MAFDVEGARKAGYSDAEIASYLASQSNFDLGGAKSAGYSDGEVIAELAKKAKAPGTSAAEKLAEINGPGNYTTPAPEAGIIDKNIGGLEAALTTITGLTGGTLGTAGGTALGILKSIADGTYGTRQGADNVERQAAEAAQALTYQPRTPEGQRQAAAVGEVMQSALPAAAVLHTLPVAATLQPIARTGAAATLDKAATAVPAGLERVKAVVTPADAGPTPGTMGSVGTAGTDIATMRRQTAESLPVPIKLTKGQADRTFEQQRFEQETAKDPALGAPLRERQADQNAAVPRNFEAWIDETGAKATSPIEVGRAVDEALVKDAAKAKAEYRVKYREAEKAGEMADPVDAQPILDYIAENQSLNAPELAGGSLGMAQREIARLSAKNGGAADGPPMLTLADAELLRRQIGNAIDANPTNATNMRAGVQLRNLIDQQTEGLGGNLYREARGARKRYAQLYEDNAIVRDLLATRKGTADRQVALENVFRRTILNGTREDLSKLRRTLQLPQSEEGMQAWRELQGATLRHIIDEATSGVATDVRGNPIVSAAKMHRAIQQLDQSGKLDFVLSKKGAQQVRDMNELVKVIYTSPPGAVNTSNTASVILAAIAEAGATGAISGLPVPVLSSVKLLTRYVKDRQTRQRILQALGEAEQNAKNQPKRPNGATVH